MKRLALLLLVCTLLAACGSTPTPEPVTIRFGFQEFDKAYFQALAEEFHEANPHITVELVTHTWDQVPRLKAEDADIFLVNEAYPLVGDPANLLMLDSFIEQDRDLNTADFYAGLLDLFERDGKTWAIPANLDAGVMFYNRDIFDAAGVAYPKDGWTWDDFLLTAKAVTDVENGIYGYVAPPTYGAAVVFVYQHGGRIMDDWHNPTRLTLDEPLTVEAVEWYARLFYEHGVAPTTPQAIRAFGGRYNQEYYGITQGKAGMWMGVFSEREGLVWPAPWEFASGMVTLPREAVSSTFGGAEIYVISAKTEQPQAAWQWLSFLSKQLPNREAPARRSLLESDAFVQQVGEQAAATLRAALSSDSVRLSSGSGNRFLMERNFHGVFTEVVSRICAGEVTAREGLTAAQARLSGE